MSPSLNLFLYFYSLQVVVDVYKSYIFIYIYNVSSGDSGVSSNRNDFPERQKKSNVSDVFFSRMFTAIIVNIIIIV